MAPDPRHLWIERRDTYMTSCRREETNVMRMNLAALLGVIVVVFGMSSLAAQQKLLR